MAKGLTAEDLRTEPDDVLVTKLKEAKEELFNLRFQAATGQLESHGRLRTVQARDRPHLHRDAGARARHRHGRGRRGGQRMTEQTQQTEKRRPSRKVLEGLVVSDKMDKTVVVSVEDRVTHRGTTR